MAVVEEQAGVRVQNLSTGSYFQHTTISYPHHTIIKETLLTKLFSESDSLFPYPF